MLKKYKHFFNIFSVIHQVIHRFPVTAFLVLLTVFVTLLSTHDINILHKDNLGYFYLFSINTAIVHLGFRLYVESHRLETKWYLAGSIALTILVASYAWLLDEYDYKPLSILFTLALLLAIMFAPYLQRNSSNNSIWYFNYQTGVAIFFAALASLVFAAGVSLVVASIGYLFELDVDSKIYADIWITSWGVLFSFYVLANLSVAFDFPDEQCTFPRGIRFIANYILMPLMYVYTLVLYAYFVRIAWQWQLPKGNLGWMISILGVTGMTTYLLVYPMREQGTRLLSLFSRYFHAVMIIPVLALLLVASIRISDYGFTENRYLLLVIGIWLLLLIVRQFYCMAKGREPSLVFAPLLLSALLLLTMFGPWGMAEVSFNSQMQRFEALLKQNNMLKNNRIFSASTDVELDDRIQLSAIADYMGEKDWRFNKFKTLLGDLVCNNGACEHRLYGRGIMQKLGIPYISAWEAKRLRQGAEESFRYYFNDNQVMLPVSGYDYISEQYFYFVEGEEKTENLILADNKVNIQLSSMKQGLLLKVDGKKVAAFNLVEKVKWLRKHIKAGKMKNRLTVLPDEAQNDYQAKLLINEINGVFHESEKIKITRANIVLLIKDAKK